MGAVADSVVAALPARRSPSTTVCNRSQCASASVTFSDSSVARLRREPGGRPCAAARASVCASSRWLRHSVSRASALTVRPTCRARRQRRAASRPPGGPGRW
ncbi:hypothetical protein C3469_04315 [Mycobacterium kansasii]|nr:hypothetical protein C3479_00195 [Mycobacterium kansasii]POY29127.1 hypothetical protein C3469_04315 [Mycobacterium kansasii]POY34233.1 hypothetical protein C3478_02235 [Mycobacterium kansasii]